jgi:UDP-N-acetylmuramate dehydrogenase
MIECVEGVDMGTGEIKKFTHDECGFGYRDSVFKKALK